MSDTSNTVMLMATDYRQELDSVCVTKIGHLKKCHTVQPCSQAVFDLITFNAADILIFLF